MGVYIAIIRKVNHSKNQLWVPAETLPFEVDQVFMDKKTEGRKPVFVLFDYMKHSSTRDKSRGLPLSIAMADSVKSSYPILTSFFYGRGSWCRLNSAGMDQLEKIFNT